MRYTYIIQIKDSLSKSHSKASENLKSNQEGNIIFIILTNQTKATIDWGSENSSKLYFINDYKLNRKFIISHNIDCCFVKLTLLSHCLSETKR